MSPFREDDDEFIRRASALALLEDDGEVVQDDIAYDELEAADQVSRRSGAGPLGLEEKASLRDQKWQGLNDLAKFSRINPPSILKGTIGGQQFVNLTVDTILNPPRIQVANWAGDDSETLPITVTFAPVQQLGNSVNLVDLRPIGIVQFGTRGFSVAAEVDIGTGTQFTVNASAITLQVTLETDPNVVFPPGTTTIASMPLAGMLSCYTTTHALPVTRSKFTISINNGFSADVIVPPFAKNVSIWRADSTLSMRADFKNSQGGTVYSRTIAGGAFYDLPIPLSTNITTVTINNTGGGGANSAACIFGLAL